LKKKCISDHHLKKREVAATELFEDQSEADQKMPRLKLQIKLFYKEGNKFLILRRQHKN